MKTNLTVKRNKLPDILEEYINSLEIDRRSDLELMFEAVDFIRNFFKSSPELGHVEILYVEMNPSTPKVYNEKSVVVTYKFAKGSETYRTEWFSNRPVARNHYAIEIDVVRRYFVVFPQNTDIEGDCL